MRTKTKKTPLSLLSFANLFSIAQSAVPVQHEPISKMGSSNTVMANITQSELPKRHRASTRSAKVSDVKHVASYTWWDKAEPTISVPGSPRWWFPPGEDIVLEPDSGTLYLDENAARHPKFPLEPLFRAALIEDPTFSSIRNADLVTDEITLGKLLGFVRGSLAHFKFRVEVAVGEDGDGETTATTLFTREERKATVPLFSQGYGQNFKEIYTKKPGPGVCGYHRVMGYNFSGLRCVVGYETDAYFPEGYEMDAYIPEHSERTLLPDDDEQADDEEELSLVAAGTDSEKTSSGLVVVRLLATKTTPVSPDSLLMIKACSRTRQPDEQDMLAQLWASRTPNLAVGAHRGGCFSAADVEFYDMAERLPQWEEEHEEDLGKLASLLIEIIAVVKGTKHGRAVVRYFGGWSMQIVDGGDKAKPALPKDLYIQLGKKVRGVADMKVKLEVNVVDVGSEWSMSMSMDTQESWDMDAQLNS